MARLLHPFFPILALGSALSLIMQDSQEQLRLEWGCKFGRSQEKYTG